MRRADGYSPSPLAGRWLGGGVKQQARQVAPKSECTLLQSFIAAGCILAYNILTCSEFSQLLASKQRIA
jgi:hypothetical protein